MGNQIGIRALSVMTLTLSACVTDIAIRKPSPSSSTQKDRPDQLAPVKLAKGECGLFVWAGQSRRFLMFSKGQNQAVMSDAGGEIPLLATKLDAEPDYHGQYPTQSFIDTRGKAYDLSFNKVATLGNSIRYSQGSWRSQDDNGWERIEAAYGLSTCIPDGNLPVEDTLSASRFDLLRPLGQGETADPVSTARMTFTPASIRKETTKVLPAVTKITRPVMPALPAPPPIKTVTKPMVRAIVEPIPEPPNNAALDQATLSVTPRQNTENGPYRIQLASYLDEDHAHAGWANLSTQSAFLTSFEPSVIPSQIKNKGLYFRLQIGAFDSKSEALENCQKLKTEGLDCFITHRKF